MFDIYNGTIFGIYIGATFGIYIGSLFGTYVGGKFGILEEKPGVYYQDDFHSNYTEINVGTLRKEKLY